MSFISSFCKKDSLFFTKIRDVKSPMYAKPGDAGLDFFMPTNLIQNDLKENGSAISTIQKNLISFEVYNDRKGIFISKINFEPGGNVLIPSGIKIKLPKGYAMLLVNRSSIASKRGIVLGACLIDEGFLGEILINLINVSGNTSFLEAGEKIAQGIKLPIASSKKCDIIEITHSEFKKFSSSRGGGGFGSTGRF